MRQRTVVCRGSSQSRVFALPLISGDRCSLSATKALQIWLLTTILLLHFRETERRINTEIVTVFRFSVSVLSPVSWLPQPLQLHLSHSKRILALGPFPISVASKPLTSWQHLQKLVLVQGKVFPPLFYWGELLQRDKVTCRKSQRGYLPIYSELRPQNFPLYLVPLLLLRNKLKHKALAIALQSRCHPHHYIIKMSRSN